MLNCKLPLSTDSDSVPTGCLVGIMFLWHGTLE